MGRKKNVVIDDDQYSIPQDDDATAAAEKAKPAKKGGKKGKKGGKSAAHDDDDDYEPAAPPPPVADEDGDEPINLVFTGKKKKKKGGAGGGMSAFDALAAAEDEDGEDEAPAASSTAASTAELEADRSDLGDDDLDFDFSKAKKKKKKGKGARPSTPDEDDDDYEPAPPPPEEDEEELAVPAAKKPQKKKKKKGGFTVDDEDIDKLLAEMEDPPQPATQEAEPEEAKGVESVAAPDADDAGGKKSKKKKKKGGFTVDDEDIDKLLAEIEDQPAPAEEPEPKAAQEEVTVAAAARVVDDAEGKKSKKKKKKSGRTAQEEEDLDKLLAELGEGPPAPEKEKPSQAPPSAPAVKEDEEDGNAEQKAGEGEVESAAAKKKKKKKEKEKEKKAAAKGERLKEEEKEVEVPKGKVDMKKLPKHVREMQEALAKRQEAEERKKKEEEERLRKEEEERLRKEEEERKAEEAKKRKKEREKEKLLKKKLEGKLLTGKQKEEAKRLEAMRRQFLEQSEVQVADGAAPEIKKKPKYESKKKKTQTKASESLKVAEEQQPEVNEANIDEEEYVMVDQESQSQVEESETKTEPDQEAEESKQEEEEDEDDWDAKSWDDIDVNLPKTNAFEEEEEKEEKPVTVPTVPAVKNVAPPVNKNSKKSENEDAGPSNGVTTKRNKGKKGSSSKDDDTKNDSNLRSPICCILGHVDTGKTKLLDCIRRTNVQEGEAGGITQQIGATYFPTENIRERTRELKADATLKVPGLLVIDTPGHESFSNLRSRGSSLCDIAILVVDIMHGLEPQTIESLNLLKDREAVFIVALNKVDRLYGWKPCPNAPIGKALRQQNEDVKMEFNTRLTDIVTQFKMQGVNTALYYKNKEMEDTFNIVPTSALSGEGIPDLLLLLVQWAQKTMEEKLTFVDEVQCTVLEVKVIEGHGTTVDVVLVNGMLHEGDQIVVCGMQGPIVTTIRALLTPHPMKELRVKGTYLHHKKIRAAQGIKISAQGLEHAIAGTALYAVRPDEDIEDLKDAVMEEMARVRNRIDKSGEGVYVQASTLGSLEALTEFLKSPAVNIPFCDFSIGPVHKKDVMKASVMLERKKEYATILAFDVKVMPDARDLAEESGVKIFVADIIYHLFDQFTAYIKNVKEEKKKESAEEAVFPCVLKIMPNCVFNKKDPIVLGVDILEGIAKIGTPICIPSKEFIDIGKIASIEINHKQVDTATKGQKVAIKIIGTNSDEQQKSFGRHFEMEDELVSHITRRSIDLLKANYRDELSLDDWKLVAKLKKILNIP
ncbi:LOW QUALITY PROTEIN: eukaryotic translation initiation factor 5B-like [Lolium rigidum]|uniref:LOW QUALITY PROTEIN: eukaryotic translation initiation factor 5B-like n=1 Tax=Lolium rigidum TaxID=89674 RepID=UPI001F5C38FA|nr:LOW QUALITY PROTEIN: eukaryotic translation initiation factor 5B-like [Lolium rigidum]